MKEIFHVAFGLHSKSLVLFSENDVLNLPKIINIGKENDYWESFECCGGWYDLHFLNDEDGISVNIYKMFGSEDNMNTDTSENGEQITWLYII